WNQTDGDCALGAVKATVGHLLTGAGAAGLIKVLLAMRNGVRPPLTNYDSEPESLAPLSSSLAFPRQASVWPNKQKRAAVSASGFGGINAHLLVQDFLPPSHSVRVEVSPPSDQIAVVGIAKRTA